MLSFLTDLHFILHDLIRIKVLGGELTLDSISIFVGAFLTALSTFIMWKKWGKDRETLINFYIVFLLALLISQPLYLLLVWATRGFREAFLKFFSGGMTIAWTFAIGVSFLYMFFYRRRELLDFYDHLLPFLAFLFGWSKAFHCFTFGCCFGKPTQLPWGVVFHPQSPAGKAFPGIPLHPVQLYNTIGAWLIIPPALWLLKRRHFEGEILLWMLLYLGLTKTFEYPYFRGDLLSPMRIWFISIPVFGISFLLLIVFYYRYLRKKEAITSSPFL